MKKTVKYKGTKTIIHVPLPIGVKSKRSVVETLAFRRGDKKEMDSDEAEKLCAGDANFEIIGSKGPIVEKVNNAVEESQTEDKDGSVEYRRRSRMSATKIKA